MSQRDDLEFSSPPRDIHKQLILGVLIVLGLLLVGALFGLLSAVESTESRIVWVAATVFGSLFLLFWYKRMVSKLN